MRISQLRLSRLRFPGRAGELQKDGTTAALMEELASDYDGYHKFLYSSLDAMRVTRPTPETHPREKDYFAAWAEIQDIVRAELLLRLCSDVKGDPKGLQAPLDVHGPVVDENDQLLRSRKLPR